MASANSLTASLSALEASHIAFFGLLAFAAKLIDQYRKIEAMAHAANVARLCELKAARKGEHEAATTKPHVSPR
jgi:hypothetical protein